MIKVLHVVGKMNTGGMETLLMNYYRKIDRNIIQFDFVAVSEGKGVYDDEIKSLGGKVLHTPRYRWYDNKEFKKWWDELLSTGQYSIVHQHNIGAATTIFPVAKKYGVKTVLHSHMEYTPKGIKECAKELFDMRAFKYTDKYLACSNEAGKSMFGNRIFEVLCNAIDVRKFEYSEELRKQTRAAIDVEDNIKLIGCVGRLTRQKNHLFALDVFSEALKNDTNTRLLIIGQGELEETIKGKVHSLNLEKYVIMLKPDPNIQKYYSAMDCFLFPSLYEGLGMVAVEAQAAGLPVIMSDTVPAAACVCNTARLSLDADLKIWAKAINDSCICRDRKNCVDSVIASGYDINDNVKKLETIYKNIVY